MSQIKLFWVAFVGIRCQWNPKQTNKQAKMLSKASRDGRQDGRDITRNAWQARKRARREHKLKTAVLQRASKLRMQCPDWMRSFHLHKAGTCGKGPRGEAWCSPEWGVLRCALPLESQLLPRDIQGNGPPWASELCGRQKTASLLVLTQASTHNSLTLWALMGWELISKVSVFLLTRRSKTK